MSNTWFRGIQHRCSHLSLPPAASRPKERRTLLDVLAVREALQRTHNHLRWVPTRHMLADALTKSGVDTTYLSTVLQQGRFSLVESMEAKSLVAARSRTRYATHARGKAVVTAA
jgi:hypothetical protein